MLLLGAASRLRATKARLAKAGFPFRLAAGHFAFCIGRFGDVVFSLPDVPPTLAPMAKENLASERSWQSGRRLFCSFFARSIHCLKKLFCCWHWSAFGPWRGSARGEGNPDLRVYAQPEQHSRVSGSDVAANRHHGRHLHVLGRCEPSRGAFQGGTVLAAMWLLVMMARCGRCPRSMRFGYGSFWLSARWPFSLSGLLGFVFANSFLAYPPDHAKPLIIIAEADTDAFHRRDAGLVGGRSARKDAQQ